MKKIYFGLFAAAMLAFAACSESMEDVMPTTERPMVTLTASADAYTPEPEAQSRAILDGSNFFWEEGDAITFFAGSYGSDQSLKTSVPATSLSNDNRTAVFSGEVPMPTYPDTFIAVYNGTGTVTSSQANFKIPATQTQTIKPKLMLAAQATNVTDPKNVKFDFKPACAFLQIPLSGVSFDKIVLEGMSGEMIAGDLQFYTSDGTCTFSGSSTSITVENVTNDCILVLPPVNFTNGYKLTFHKDGQIMVKTYAAKNMQLGWLYGVNTIDTWQPISIDLAGVRTSYDYSRDFRANLNDGSAKDANAKANNKIYLDEVVVKGISSKLLAADAVTVTVNGTSVKSNAIAGADANGVRFTFATKEVTANDWKDYTVTATVSYQETTQATETKTVKITGLPYSYDFHATQAIPSNWTASNTRWENTGLTTKLVICYKGSDGYLISPKFNFSGAAEYRVESQYYSTNGLTSGATIELRIGTSNNTSPSSQYKTHSVKCNVDTKENHSSYSNSLDMTSDYSRVSIHHDRSKTGLNSTTDYLCVYEFHLKYQ